MLPDFWVSTSNKAMIEPFCWHSNVWLRESSVRSTSPMAKPRRRQQSLKNWERMQKESRHRQPTTTDWLLECCCIWRAILDRTLHWQWVNAHVCALRETVTQDCNWTNWKISVEYHQQRIDSKSKQLQVKDWLLHWCKFCGTLGVQRQARSILCEEQDPIHYSHCKLPCFLDIKTTDGYCYIYNEGQIQRPEYGNAWCTTA